MSICKFIALSQCILISLYILTTQDQISHTDHYISFNSGLHQSQFPNGCLDLGFSPNRRDTCSRHDGVCIHNSHSISQGVAVSTEHLLMTLDQHLVTRRLFFISTWLSLKDAECKVYFSIVKGCYIYHKLLSRKFRYVLLPSLCVCCI